MSEFQKAKTACFLKVDALEHKIQYRKCEQRAERALLGVTNTGMKKYLSKQDIPERREDINTTDNRNNIHPNVIPQTALVDNINNIHQNVIPQIALVDNESVNEENVASEDEEHSHMKENIVIEDEEHSNMKENIVIEDDE